MSLAGRDRARHRGRSAPPPGAARRPHRPAEPITADRPAAPGAAAVVAHARPGRAAGDGPRPVQGDQRRARPRPRRPAADRAEPPARGSAGRNRHGRPPRRRRVRRAADRPGNLEEAGRVAAEIRHALEQPFHLGGISLQVNASIGIAVYPDHAVDGETLARRADVAMYTAKRTGGGFAVYAPEHDQSSIRRLSLLGEMRRAIAEDELVLHFQPSVDLATGDLARRRGAGALAAPRARADAPSRVHRARRGVGHDPVAHPVGARARHRDDLRLARRGRRSSRWRSTCPCATSTTSSCPRGSTSCSPTGGSRRRC